MVAPHRGATTDVELAHWIGSQVSGKLVWSSIYGWLESDSGVWVRVSESAVQEIVAGLLTELMEWRAKNASGNPRALGALQAISTVKAASTLLRGTVEERGDPFDQSPYELNCTNGVVDLRTGKIRDHLTTDRFMKQTAIEYDPDAFSEDFENVLGAMERDVEQWMQVRLGDAIIGHPSAGDMMHFLHGNASNGKTVLLAAVLGAIGSYGSTVPAALMLGGATGHSTDMMTLKGLRVAVLEELPEGRNLNVQRLKSITGTEQLTARYIRQDNVTFNLTHSMFVTTNYDLKVAEQDDGTWRRIAVVPFPFKYVDDPLEDHEKAKIQGLRERMKAGDKAALAWMVEGAMRVLGDARMGERAAMPTQVKAATQAMRSSADPIAHWAEECLLAGVDSFVTQADLYASYSGWCVRSGMQPVASIRFAGRLEESTVSLMFRKARLNGTRGFRGLQINARRL